MSTVKHLKFRTPEIFAVVTLKLTTIYSRVMHPKNADRIANNVDPGQTAPLGAV